MDHRNKEPQPDATTRALGLEEIERRLEISPLVLAGHDSGGLQAKPSTCCSCKIGDEDWTQDEPDGTGDETGGGSGGEKPGGMP
jgi:hypothetical protein